MAKKNNKEQEIGDVLSKGERFFEKHSNLIFYIGLGIVIAAFGVWAYIEYVAKPRQQTAYEEIFSAEDSFIRGQDSLVLASGGVSENGVLSVAKKYSGTKAGDLAHLYAGISYYDLGQYENAISELKKYNSKDLMVSASVLRMIGDCYVQLDKLDEAVGYFRNAADKAANEVISPECLIKAARVYESQQEYLKALELYKEVKDKYYTAPEAKTVEADIIRLEAIAN